MKKIILIFILIIAIGGFFFLSRGDKENKVAKNNYCFAYSSEEGDTFNLNFSLRGENVLGYYEFSENENLQSGTLEGIIAPDTEELDLRPLALWWNTEDVTRQLVLFADKGFEFVNVGVGQMIEDDRGRLIYLDNRSVSYGLTLGRVDCK